MEEYKSGLDTVHQKVEFLGKDCNWFTEAKLEATTPQYVIFDIGLMNI